MDRMCVMVLPCFTKNVFKMFLSKSSEKARKKEITIEANLWHYTTTNGGLHPVKLKVTANRKTKNYRLQVGGKNLFISKADWDQMNGPGRIPKALSKINEEINIATTKARLAANDVVQGGRPFSFDLFEKTYFAKEASTGFMGAFEVYLNKILQEERIGTYRAYRNAYSAFKDFLAGREISPYDLTVDLLKAFERFLMTQRKRTVGATTVSMYARTLRIIYNLCADQDPNLKQYYPFGNSKRGKFRISDSRNGAKKGDALTIEQIKTFISTTPEPGSPTWEAKMYWLFSFYCQGMNFRDICFLRDTNIHGDIIRYTRQKTKRTDSGEILEISITPVIREIMEALKSHGRRKGSFVFPILPQEHTDPLKIEGLVLQKIKTTNKWLRRLCEGTGIPIVTTYWSRHSYASLLKLSGTSVEAIRELLGHSDLRTTEHYLKRFDHSHLAAINKGLQQLVNPGNVIPVNSE